MDKLKRCYHQERILPAILISVLIPLIVCCATTIEVYANNMEEFLFSIWDFLPLCLLIGLLISILNFCVLFFVPDLAYQIIGHGMLALATLLFLQGTYLNGNLNSLAGDKLGSNQLSLGIKLLNLGIWLILIGGAIGITFVKKIQTAVNRIAMVLVSIVIFTQLINPLFAIFNNPNIFMAKEDKLKHGDYASVAKFASTKGITTLSTNHNVFYFLIDRFDEYYVEEVMRNKPELFEMLDGFTHFKDNISLYGHTYPSVAYMLTDYRYDNELTRVQNLTKAYEGNQTIRTLHDNGYQINLFGQEYYDFFAGTLPDYVANLSDVSEYKVSKPWFLVAQMLGLSLYRCFPFLLKPIFVYITSNTFNSCLTIKDAAGYDQYTGNNKATLKLVQNTPFQTTEDHVFTFMHLDGCHDADLDYHEDGTTKQSAKDVKMLTQLVTECFEVIKLYLNELENKGLYKDATIIITGDHANPADRKDVLSKPQLTALFVKTAGSTTKGLQTSSAPVTHGNIWPTIMAAENIESDTEFGTTLSDVDDAVTREFIWQPYTQHSYAESYYEIKGSARTFANWKLIKTIYKDKFLLD